MSTTVWFAMWRCHCSTITATEAEVTARCPAHDAELLAGPPEPVVDPAPTVALGYEPAELCGCHLHGGAA